MSVSAAFEQLAGAISALPSSLSQSVSTVPRLLHQLASDLSPATTSLEAAQQQQLLTNSTWLAANVQHLGDLIKTIPKSDVEASSRQDLLSIIEFGSTRYDIMTLWAPEVWSIFVMYMLALTCKCLTMIMLTRGAVSRARSQAFEEGQSPVSAEAAKALLSKPSKAMIGHAINLVVSTIVLGLQLAAWRLFVVPGQPIRFEDLKLITMGIKLLTVGYAVDLIFGDVNWEIFLHHIFTYGLLLAGQISVSKTNSAKFARLAEWLMLQATLEQSTYFAMACYHASTYLKLQSHRPKLQRVLLRMSGAALTFTKFITWPQKLVPAAMALYWLGRMWRDIDGVSEGRFWLAWATCLLCTLITLQIKFCDDIVPICNHVHYKLNGGRPPSRVGPVMNLLSRPLHRGRRRHSSATLASSMSDSLALEEKGVHINVLRQDHHDPASSQDTLSMAKFAAATGAVAQPEVARLEGRRPPLKTIQTQETTFSFKGPETESSSEK